jgi:alginate O-acetyltransferase complex protein AlgI
MRWKQILLTIASYIFYGWANPWFVFLMMFSTTMDYAIGLIITGKWRFFKSDKNSLNAQRKLGLVLSIVGNMGLLGFFKYFVFAQSNLNMLLEAFGGAGFEIIKIVLPTGISFYTFQSMSYTIDLYRGEVKPAKSLLDFACFVSLFPQLIAGPIVRYSHLADQLSFRTHTISKFAIGISFFVIGLAKKILLANHIGEVADAAFGAGSLIWYDAWAGVLAYAFQIYFDFSGYSDMAIGLGLMLGFQFPKNFDSPYHAESITDFWRRWHISLSTWLRDYLYFPLGGNRKGKRRTYFNLAIVMFLGGLWHGAKWTFVVWGSIHGIMLALERMMGKKSIYNLLPRPFRVMITFVIILITWVFFRSGSISIAGKYLSSMIGIRQQFGGSALLGSLIYSRDHIFVFIACAVVVWFGKQSWELAQKNFALKAVTIIALFIWSLMAMYTQSYNPFLYFQF